MSAPNSGLGIRSYFAQLRWKFPLALGGSRSTNTDLVHLVRCESGQSIATSHDLTKKCWFRKGHPFISGKSRLVEIWPDGFAWIFLERAGFLSLLSIGHTF